MKNRRKLPVGVSSFIDRHGRERFRFRKARHPTHYFKAAFGTPEFQAELDACRAGTWRQVESRAAPGTIDDLCGRFYASIAFNSAGDDKRNSNRGIIEAFRREHGSKRVASLRFDHVEAILLTKSEKRPGPRGQTIGGKAAAAALRKQLVRLFDLAVKLGYIDTNPVRLAAAVKVPATGGYHSWTDAEIEQYQLRWPLGTKARLALEIFLWTMQRLGDAAKFGGEHLKQGRVHIQHSKTGRWVWLPAAPQLIEAIGAMDAVGVKTFLVTDFGKPFSVDGLGNKMREWCDAAGLPHCTAHGLRKAVARRLAENEATQVQLKAAGGWAGDAEVATYTAAADQQRNAEVALTRLSNADLANRASKLAKSND